EVLSVGAGAGLLSEPLANSIERASVAAGMGNGISFLSYLSNSIRRDDGREIPYSIVTGIPGEAADLLKRAAGGEPLPGCDDVASEAIRPESSVASLPPIFLNDWAAKDLDVK